MKKLLLPLLIFTLFQLFPSSLLADCTGCCAQSGGAICMSGLTICKDQTPMSIECLEKNCNKCDGSEDGSNTSPAKPTKKKARFPGFPQNFESKDKAILFLKHVYRNGGRTFFCNKKFKKGKSMRYRHVVPLPKNIDPKIAADPQNLVPATKKCFKIKNPRKSARGDLVRIYRYLEDRYGVKLIPASKSNIFSIWTLEDPVDRAECQRVLNHGNGIIPGIYENFCKKL